MKLNWDQTGMPASLVDQAGKRRTLSEFKSVLRDAQDQILSTLDAESMARELVESDGRQYVEMVRELSTSLANTKRELDDANRRYERLVADLEKRGIRIGEDELSRNDVRQLQNPWTRLSQSRQKEDFLPYPTRLRQTRPQESEVLQLPHVDEPPAEPESAADHVDEWEEWNLKFQSLLG